MRAGKVQTTVFLAQIFGHIGNVGELVGVKMRIVVRADDDVRPAPDVRGNCRLGSQVLPVLTLHCDSYSGCFSESLAVGQPLVFIALHEALPAQHPQQLWTRGCDSCWAAACSKADLT
jgi:hypothetical protein